MEDKKFKYTYSAPTKTERQEIEDIRKDYLPEEDRSIKLREMRNLDKRVKNIPRILAFTVGIVGTLTFGLGLTCILEWHLMLLGVIVSIIGCVPIGLAYFVYVKSKAKLTEKYKDRILALSDELLNEEKKEENK